MAEDTVKVTIAPKNALAIIGQLDQCGEVWGFVGHEKAHLKGNFPSKRVIDLTVGDECIMEVTLNDDGTWSATAHVCIGEKK